MDSVVLHDLGNSDSENTNCDELGISASELQFLY